MLTAKIDSFVCNVPGAGEPAGGGLEADDAAERRGHPDGSPAVDAERHRAEPRAHDGRRAARRSPRHLPGVVRVPRRPAFDGTIVSTGLGSCALLATARAFAVPRTCGGARGGEQRS